MQEEQRTPTSLETILVDTSPKELCRCDPLLSLLFWLSPRSTWPVMVIALTIYGLVIVGGGIAVSDHYRQSGTRFLHILDPKELPIIIFLYGVFIPLLWVFYVWQLRGVSNALRRLNQNRAIGDYKNGLVVYQPSASFNKAYNLLVPLIATGVGLFIWLSNMSSPNDPFYFGEPDIWYRLNPLYFWIFVVPLVFVNVYIVSWIVIRLIVTAVMFTRVFRVFEIRPRPFHPDGCTGLAPVGDYAIRSALFVVLWGFWLFFFTTYPLLFGQPLNLSLRIDVILLFAVYLIAVPLSLLPPVWGAHLVLGEAKTKLLENWAGEIQDLLSESSVANILASKDLLLEYERRFEIVTKKYHTWPFRQLAIKSLGVTAITPIILELIKQFITYMQRHGAP